MSNEKATILQMVENGKISVDDAVKLIEALKAENADYYDRHHFFDSIEFEEKVNRFANATESFARDLSAKMNETWKGVEPKVKSAAKVAIEKTVETIDRVSCALSESLKTFEENQESTGNGEPPAEAPAESAEADDVPREN